MKFHTLTINNFLTVSHAQLGLADRGLNVIQGVNDDDSSASSNGSGKSSIVDALCWCLYGVTARGVKGDAVVNRTVGKDCWVSLTMRHKATEYAVVRHRKHKTGKNSLRLLGKTIDSTGVAIVTTDLTKGTDAETQVALEKILGCSYEVFVAAVYAGQEVMPDLPRMGDRDLKRLIEEAAGMQRIERAYLVARDRLNAVKTEHANGCTAAARLEDILGSDKSALEAAERDMVEWALKLHERIEAAKDGLRKELEVLKELKNRLTPMSAALPDTRAKITELKAQLAGHKKLEAEWQAAQRAAADADRKINRAGLTVVADKIKLIRERIAHAGTRVGVPCDECGKPHTEEDKALYLEAQNKLLTEATAEAFRVKTEVEAQITHAKALQGLAADKHALIPDVSAVLAELNTHEEAVKAHDRLEAQIVLQGKNVDAANTKLSVVKAETNPHLAVRDSLAGRVKTLSEQLVEQHLKNKELERKVEIADAVVKTFGPAGVRAQILDTVTPYLNARTSDYLSVLSDGNLTAVWTTLTKDSKGELKEKFSIDVTNKTGADSFTGLSGGEKRKVRLATALALQDLVASRATQPIDCWIGDEIDDALDPAGLERLMTILERKARERGTVLVISHNSLTDWCDQITTVRKKDGMSSVEGALCE